MFGKKKKKQENAQEQEEIISGVDNSKTLLQLNKSGLKDLIAPSGIDMSHYDYLEIFSKISRFARTFYISTLPRQATFPYFLSDIYEF